VEHLCTPRDAHCALLGCEGLCEFFLVLDADCAGQQSAQRLRNRYGANSAAGPRLPERRENAQEKCRGGCPFAPARDGAAGEVIEHPVERLLRPFVAQQELPVFEAASGCSRPGLPARRA